jgi:hypothetical protein
MTKRKRKKTAAIALKSGAWVAETVPVSLVDDYLNNGIVATVLTMVHAV